VLVGRNADHSDGEIHDHDDDGAEHDDEDDDDDDDDDDDIEDDEVGFLKLNLEVIAFNLFIVMHKVESS